MPRYNTGDIIGSGNQKDVYPDLENPDNVYAKFKKSFGNEYPETRFQIKGRFYLTKILHLLFPKNIPDARGAAASGHGLLRLQKFETDSTHQAIENVRIKIRKGLPIGPKEGQQAQKDSKKRSEEPMVKDFIHRMGQIGLTSNAVDPTGANYSYNAEGDLQYLDNSFRPWIIIPAFRKIRKNYDPDKLKSAIDEINPGATGYLERLEQLFLEEQRNYKDHPEEYEVKA